MALEYEFLMQDSETQKIYDLSSVVDGDINFISEMQNGASKLTFNYVDRYMFSNGSVVRFKYNKSDIFYGYVFNISNNKGKIAVTAYDSLRYFKYKDTKILNGYSVEKLIREIAEDRQTLRVGTIRPTYYTLADRIEDNKTYLDMVYDGLSDVLLGTGRKYILSDNFGALQLLEATEMRLPIVLGDESYALDYTYEKSIDGETYNRIKLAQDNKTTGTRENYIVEDSKSMSKWGVLQYYEKVNENMNSAQIKEKAEKLLKYYNQEEKKFTLPCIGDTRVRGGSGVYIDIAELGLKQWALVDKVNHKFKGSIHTMDLELII